MAITKEITITASNNSATSSGLIYTYIGDGGITLDFTVLESSYIIKTNNLRRKITRNMIEFNDTKQASACIKKPDGEEINTQRFPIIDNKFKLVLSKELMDEMDEVGRYKIQIHLYDSNEVEANRISIAPVEFLEVLKPLCNNQTNPLPATVDRTTIGESIISKEPSVGDTHDEHGVYIKTKWVGGHIISSAAMNKIEDGIHKTSNIIKTAVENISNLNVKYEELSPKYNELNSKYEEVNETISGLDGLYQTKDDNSLNTSTKNITNSINEVLSISENNKEDILQMNNSIYKIDAHNDRQDVYIDSLFRETSNNRTTFKKYTNIVDLTGSSKNGVLEIDTLCGRTFDNKWNPSNIIKTGDAQILNDIVDFTTTNHIYSNFFLDVMGDYKADSDYTLIVDVFENTLPESDWIHFTANSGNNQEQKDIFTAENTRIQGGATGRHIFNLKTKSDISGIKYAMRSFATNFNANSGLRVRLSIMLFEGKISHDQSPNILVKDSMSSFEDMEVTQDMVDDGLEESKNLNKYKLNFVVIGNNLINGSLENGKWSFNLKRKDESTNHMRLDSICKCTPNTKYTLSVDGNILSDFNGTVSFYDFNLEHLGASFNINNTIKTFTTPSQAYYFTFHINKLESGSDGTPAKIQLAKYGNSDEYEDYKEDRFSLYLSTPLKMNDKIIFREDGLYHYHNDHIDLDQPEYEKISDAEIFLDITNNATLFIETKIPIWSISGTYTIDIPSVYEIKKTNDSQDDVIGILLSVTNDLYNSISPLLIDTNSEIGDKLKNNINIISELMKKYKK